MRSYVDLVLKKEKKAISLELIVSKIEQLRNSKLTEEEIKEVLDTLEEDVSNLDVLKTPTNEYILLTKTSFRKGRFYSDKNGGVVSVTNSYIDRDGKLIVSSEEFNVDKEYTFGAIDGDYVLIDSSSGNTKVSKILDRQLEYIAGEVYRTGESYFVRPVDSKKQFLTIALEGEAIEGERVEVVLNKQTAPNFYHGTITKVFNHKDDPTEAILWEAFKHGVDNEFSREALEQLEHIPTEVRDSDRIGREDLTHWEVFTIDGKDTKDMDDAISLTINERGNYVLGVHITDIASIVPEGSPLDREAFRKGNSFYLGGTVLPMFPHKISNGIGSLNPYVDRMTISCIMEISPEGEVLSHRISPTIIRSRKKMTYESVNKLLKKGEVEEGYEEFSETLLRMYKLSLILKKNRILDGATDFNRGELKEKRDESGKIIGFGSRIQDAAENLIEEFMVLANQEVDKDLTSKGFPFLHRVHGYPNEARLENLLRLLDAVGLPFAEYSATDLAYDHKAYQKLISHINRSGPLRDVLLTEAIRCMSRAKYSHESIGHYGLAKRYYCHFTSPVRRDADLTDQRIIWDFLFKRDNIEKNVHKWAKKLPEIAERTSKQERIANDTEKDVLKMICAEYMEEHVGEEFDATITELSSNGLVVQLDNLMEGNVRMRDLGGHYVYSEKNYALISKDGEEPYFLGERLHLMLKHASRDAKKIDFCVIDKIYDSNVRYREDIYNDVKMKMKKRRAKRKK